MAQQQLETIQLPPSPFVKRMSAMLEYGPLDILDVGCFMGRNALYLAGLGHNVLAIDCDVENLLTSQSEKPENLQFVGADIRKLPFRKKFDVVLMNEVIHMVPKEDHKLVIDGLNAVTKPHGFHVVSGYVGDRAQALGPNELYRAYANPSWEILEYTEDEQTLLEYGDASELTSLARIIAFKR